MNDVQILVLLLSISSPLRVSGVWVERFTLAIIKAKIPGFDYGIKPDPQIGVNIYAKLGQGFTDLFRYRTEMMFGEATPIYNVNIVYDRKRSVKRISTNDTLEFDIVDRGVVVHRAAFQMREFLDIHYNNKVIEYSFRRADNGLKGSLYFKVHLFVLKAVIASVAEIGSTATPRNGSTEAASTTPAGRTTK